MRVREIVRDVRQTFAGNIERIWPVVITGGDDDFLATEFVLRARFVVRVDDECAVVAANPVNGFVKPRFDSVVFDGAAVIVESLGAGWLPLRRSSSAGRQFPCARAW